MKKQFLLSALLVLACLFSARGQEEFWDTLRAVPGGIVNELFYSETTNTIFAQLSDTWSDPNIYKSEDDGLTWQNVNNPDSIVGITFSPNGDLYAQVQFPNSSQYFDIYKSSDNGSTWDIVDTESPYHSRVKTSPGRIFALYGVIFNDPEGVYYSDNGGIDWNLSLEINLGLISFQQDIQVNEFGHIIFKDKYISKDQGLSWDTVAVDYTSQVNWKTVFFESDKFAFIDKNSSGQSKLFLGKLNDPDFRQQVAPDSTGILNGFHSHPHRLADGRYLLIVNQSVYLSEDQCETWEYWSTHPASNTDNEYLLQFLGQTTPNGKLFCLIDQNLHSSSDNGLTWDFSSYGINNSHVSKIRVSENPNTIWANNESGLFKSTNEGEDWEDVFVQGKHAFFKNLQDYKFDSDKNLYIVADEKLFVQKNGSDTIGTATLPDAFHGDVFLGNAVGEIYGRIGWSGVMKSSNFGEDWELILPNVDIVNLKVHLTGRLYAQIVPFLFSPHTPLIYSDDNGITWSNMELPESNVNFFELEKNGILYLFGYGSAFRSDDHGLSWTELEMLIDFARKSAINSKGDIFILGNGTVSSLARSNNLGVNWTGLPESVFGNVNPNSNTLTMDSKDYLFVGSSSNNGIHRILRTANPTTQGGAYLFGNASKSEDEDCTTFDPMFPLGNILIEAQNSGIWYSRTDTLAADYQMFIDTGTYMVTAIPPLPFFWDTCSTTVDLPVENDTTWADFSIPANGNCPFITVDLAIPFLERCFEQNITIQYCNHGTEPADSVVIFLEIDEFLTLTDTVLNWVAVPDTTNLFSLTLPGTGVNDCQTISTPVLVSCDAELGQTHCLTVNGWPDLLCFSPPNWSGAEIEAAAECQDSVVVLQLENVGTATSQTLDFVIIEDDVVLFQGDETYDVAEVFEYTHPANGSFLRIESEQEPGHPFPGPVSAWEIGCNGSGEPSFEFIEQFPQGDAFGSEDSNCANNAGSYDPNDKTGSPLGYGPDHLINPGTDIEYLIRFQNTGTAPAHNVVIKDTLSSLFLPSSIRVGAASHLFTWDLSGSGILTFRFEDIELPDSLSNEPESHGFISFKIAHRPELELGSLLENKAAIYFDFNPPIITDTSFHLLGEDFLEVVSNVEEGPSANNIALSIYPNPAIDRAVIQLPVSSGTPRNLYVYSSFGQLLRAEKVNDKQTYIFERKNLPAGVYLLELIDEHGMITGTGKIVF